MQVRIPDPWHGVVTFGPPVIGMLTALFLICVLQWVAQQPLPAVAQEPMDPMAMRLLLGMP